jgi:hypothetical protein
MLHPSIEPKTRAVVKINDKRWPTLLVFTSFVGAGAALWFGTNSDAAPPANLPLEVATPAIATSPGGLPVVLNLLLIPVSSAAFCHPPFVDAYQLNPLAPDGQAKLEELLRPPPSGSPLLALEPEVAQAKNAWCFAPGPHDDLNLQNWCCRRSTGEAPSSVTIPELRKLAPKAGKREFTVVGWVSKVYTCPPCPPEAVCKPCMRDNVILSAEKRTHDSYDLDDKDVIVFVDPADRFVVGKRYSLTVRFSTKKTTGEPFNDLESVHAAPASR